MEKLILFLSPESKIPIPYIPRWSRPGLRIYQKKLNPCNARIGCLAKGELHVNG